MRIESVVGNGIAVLSRNDLSGKSEHNTFRSGGSSVDAIRSPSVHEEEDESVSVMPPFVLHAVLARLRTGIYLLTKPVCSVPSQPYCVARNGPCKTVRAIARFDLTRTAILIPSAFPYFCCLLDHPPVTLEGVPALKYAGLLEKQPHYARGRRSRWVADFLM